MLLDDCWCRLQLWNTPERAVGVTMRINESDGEGTRHTNFIRPRGLFVDADSRASRDATVEFIRGTELWPTMIVQSSTDDKMHGYWVLTSASRVLVPWDAWSAMQRALATACRSDTSLDDPPQAMRVSGTLNLKDPANPRPVRLLLDSGPLYDFEEFVKRSGLALEPRRKARAGSRSPKALQTADGGFFWAQTQGVGGASRGRAAAHPKFHCQRR